MKGSVLRKRRDKLLRRQQWILHELAGVHAGEYGMEYCEILAEHASKMRLNGLTPDPRLDESMVRSVTES